MKQTNEKLRIINYETKIPQKKSSNIRIITTFDTDFTFKHFISKCLLQYLNY
jgi:hypothetical protein